MNLQANKQKNETEEEKEKALAKEREKERRKMIRTKYGQTPLRHARKGVTSCIVAATVLFFLILMVGTAFTSDVVLSVWYGLWGLCTLGLAVYGLVEGIQGFQERDKNYLTCWIGTVINGLLTLSLVGIFIRGFF